MRKASPVIVEQSFKASPQAVWNAITNRDQMIQWYFDNIPAFEATVGFKTQFNVESDGKDFFHMWEVTNAVPNKLIAYNWVYANYPGDAHVSFELVKDGEKTNLKLTARGMESFPQEIPEFTRESCQAGWNYFIKQSLKAYLK